MLVLSRKPGEQLAIGNDVIVTILEMRSSCVRVGIEAPNRVPIMRVERLEELRKDIEQRKAEDEP